MTGIAQVLFPHQANGSLIEQNGKVIGSELIGQNFASAKYFHGRPSAASGNALMTRPIRPAPILGPTSKALIERVKADAAKLACRKSQRAGAGRSGHHFGQRPRPRHHARRRLFQVPRVAKARGLSEGAVRQLVHDAYRRPRSRRHRRAACQCAEAQSGAGRHAAAAWPNVPRKLGITRHDGRAAATRPSPEALLRTGGARKAAAG